MKFIIHIILVFALTAPLEGCLLAAAAGAGGTYLVNNEYQKSKVKQNRAVEKSAVRKEQSRAKIENSRTISDNNRIQSKINTKFLGGGLTSVLTVHTIAKDGIITLYGNVPSQVVADRALKIAKSIKGVKEVISNIIVVEVQLQPKNSSLTP